MTALVFWQQHKITQKQRNLLNGHGSGVVWFTGLSGSGKSTLAGALEEALYQRQVRTYLLDGDNLRHGLCVDLGFSEKDRTESLRRAGEVASLMSESGLLVLAAFVSPLRSQREQLKEQIGKENFLEIHVATSLEECERRDVKGLYARARSGELTGMTGISAPYESPVQADLRLHTESDSMEKSVAALLQLLEEKGWLPVW
ncbi:adenylyl-sulfate kinase [Aliidiomarina minuta]|uniref:Adenylyl-sulfate kinase n=1 Tax=Aliidiomarina minuta TaxID=880057 RepID=A0A432W103_9GAMM|nr:adenylyl-sulfate kinase [Aliidiomarina minuta]RUO22911.1 adenylyl-sulfate kinase [Aliidiomarina minuta]